MPILAVVGLLFSLVGLVASIFILIHAFQQSVGKGFMVLCIPCYIIYYMAQEFQHPKKNLIVAGWVVGVLGNVLMNVLSRM